MIGKIKSLRLREWRRRADITQDDMSEALGVRQTTVSRYELGKNRVTAEVLITYIQLIRQKGLVCTLEDLVEYDADLKESAERDADSWTAPTPVSSPALVPMG